MKFLHTADWQIGMRAAHVGEAGARVREERLAAAARAMDTARAHGADFVVLAGDTFEDNGIDRVLVQRVADVLAGAGRPVFVLPGNHDPSIHGSVWDHPAWRSIPSVRVLRERVPVEVPGGVLYPCPALEKRSTKDPTTWISGASAGAGPGAARIRVGLAHGTVEGVHRDEPDFPVPRDAAARAGLDYLALGHWHSVTPYTDPRDGGVRMAYSGTHEQTKFGERDSGNVLLVEIDAAGAIPRVTTVRTGGLRWLVLECDARAPEDLARLRERVESLAAPAATLVHVRISGVLSAQSRDDLVRIGDLVESRFLYGRVSVEGLSPSPDDDAWLYKLPAGAVREAAARLRDLADPAFAGPRPEGATHEVASWALLELYELVTEAAT